MIALRNGTFEQVGDNLILLVTLDTEKHHVVTGAALELEREVATVLVRDDVVAGERVATATHDAPVAHRTQVERVVPVAESLGFKVQLNCALVDTRCETLAQVPVESSRVNLGH